MIWKHLNLVCVKSNECKGLYDLFLKCEQSTHCELQLQQKILRWTPRGGKKKKKKGAKEKARHFCKVDILIQCALWFPRRETTKNGRCKRFRLFSLTLVHYIINVLMPSLVVSVVGAKTF